ncbi:MAG: indole-3-glycerol-phosphate synthase, partial [Puniceicoccaceae bacterium]
APAADPRDQAIRYREGGADALSVLTDERYFGGTLADLQAVSNHLGPKGPPRLRKDFTIHPLQILEALEAGASAILLIVRALEDDALLRLREAADAAGLASLFEIHSEPELERALRAGASIIGVNNRDLAAFRTDLALSERLIPQIPAPIVRISESGIATAADAARARAAGADAILVGEALMRAPDPAELLGALAVA